MYILGLHAGGHDAAASVWRDYELLAAVQSERLTRVKTQGGWPAAALDEVLSIAGIERGDVGAITLTRSLVDRRYVRFRGTARVADLWSRHWRHKADISFSRALRKAGEANAARLFRGDLFLADHGFAPATIVHFPNHHLAHALSALFFTTWDNALLYTADAHGDNVQYSARVLRGRELQCLFGGEDMLLQPPEHDSIARAYAFATEACGFRSFRHEGKLTGLAAYGEPVVAEAFEALFEIGPRGKICGRFNSTADLRKRITALCAGVPREHIAASIQQALETLVGASVDALLGAHPVDHLGLAGGIFANVRLNALLKARTGTREIFICPAMGDEGMVVGGPLDYLLARDGLDAWLAARKPLQHCYWGRPYDGAIDDLLSTADGLQRHQEPIARTVELLEAGKAGAIYHGAMEFGPRALGARSILASPADATINQVLNARLARTEFMPFAPYVLEEDAREVFDIDAADAYACRFMTITVPVRPAWRDRIPGVVHIDGTARPQIVRRADNPLYYDILAAFKQRTGIPVLVNTSFNAHEEPIVDTPAQCLRALLDGRIDFVVTANAVYQPPP